MQNNYDKLQKKIKITFKDINLLDTAFVHTSYLNEHKTIKPGHEGATQAPTSNERLEFLGDAVLELVVTEYLYKTFPKQEEGVLTNWRSALVKGKHLAEIANYLELGKYLYLSRGEERSGGREKNYILANTLEALIGAIFLDQSYKTAHVFIDEFIIKRLDEILKKGHHIDAKSKLQEISQETLGITPEYRVHEQEGPDHDKTFTMGAYIGEELIGTGKGSSKQKAQQEAAEQALKNKHWE